MLLKTLCSKFIVIVLLIKVVNIGFYVKAINGNNRNCQKCLPMKIRNELMYDQFFI